MRDKIRSENEININFLVILHLIAIVSLIFPYGFPLFSIVMMLFFIYMLFTKSLSLKISVYIGILYLSILVYIMGIFNSRGILYSIVISDLVNIVLICILLIITGSYNRIQYKKVIHRTLISFSYIVPILALLSLYKYYLLLNNNYIEYFEIEGRKYPWGTSLMPDYNMFALGMIIGLISLTYMIKNSDRIINQLIGVISSLIVILSILFSGSRRGWIVVVFVAIFFLYKAIKRLTLNTIKQNMFIFTAIFISIVIFIFGFKDYINISITNQVELDKLEYRYSTLEDFSESFSDRTNRLEYGLELINNFNVTQLLIGNGFSYLPLYGEEFLQAGKQDYPHNPLLSSFLYAGMIGFIVTLILVLIPIFRSIYEQKIFHKEYFLIYLIVLLFLIQSGNSIFSINILWFLIVHFCLIPMSDCKKGNNYNESYSYGTK